MNGKLPEGYGAINTIDPAITTTAGYLHDLFGCDGCVPAALAVLMHLSVQHGRDMKDIIELMPRMEHSCRHAQDILAAAREKAEGVAVVN